MSDELIRKKDALDALMAERKHLLANGQKGAEHVLTHHGYNVIDELPPVQPKHGHWMIEPTEEPEYCKCSECGYVNLIIEVFSFDGYHYCPNCGAKMERNEDGTD